MQGTHGGGGAGGGGGGGGGGGAGDDDWTDVAGDGGSGGGGGGGGGEGGQGGFGGGGSFGVFLWANSSSTNFVNCNITGGSSLASGGTGGNGGAGGAGGGSTGGGCQCGDGNRGGAGGGGSQGGAGGKGGDGSPGVRIALASQGSGTAPTTSGMTGTINSTATFTATIPTTPAVTVDAQNGKLCTYSVIALTKASGNWTLPSGITYIDENGPNDGAASYNSASSPANVYATTANSWYGVTGPLTYDNLFRVLDSRTLPTINTIAAPCIGGNITPTLGAGSYGTVVDHKWEVFSGTSASGTAVFTTTGSATPTIGPFTSAGTYIVKYSQRELCCGWSIPIFSATFTVVADPSAPNALTKTSGSNIPDVCIGATGLGVNATTVTSGGSGTCSVEYSYFTPQANAWSAWSTSVPSSISAGTVTGQVKVKARTNCNGSGCDISVETAEVVWNVVDDPAAGSLSRGTVQQSTVCAGTTLDVLVTGGTGGVAPVTDAIQYRIGTTGGWTAYSGAFTANTAGDYYFQTQRTSSVNGCTSSAWLPSGNGELLYTVIAAPVQKTVSVTTSPICTGSSTTIILNSSQNGVDYKLWNVTDNTFSAVQTGDGSSNLSFTTNALTATKTFKIIATLSPCADVNMNNDVAVTVTVVTAAPSAITASANSLSLCVGGSFNLNATGGSGAASWSWTGPNSYTNNVQDPAAFTTVSASAGNYTASATNVCGTTTSNTLTLALASAVPTAVTASANSLALCVGNSFDLSATGGTGAASWSWSGPNSYTNTNQDPAAFTTVAGSAGNYIATATNACGSTNSNTLALALTSSAPTAVTASANALSLCEGASFDLNATGGTGATSWSWSGPNSYSNTNQNPAAFTTLSASAGNYIATATNVCGSTNSNTLALALTATTPSAVTASANSLAMCAGSSFDLNATGGTGATSWSWSGPNSYSNANQNPAAFNTVAASAGNYIATATNVCGNTTSNTLTLAVTPSVPSAVTASATSANLCVGGSLDLNATGGTGATSWSWTGPNSYSNSSQDPVSFVTTSASAGTYVATATNICGSTASNNLAVTVVTGPIQRTIQVASSTVCSGTPGTVQVLSSESGTVYQLYNTTTSANVGATQTGNGSTLNFSTGNLTSASTFKVIASRNPCTALDMNNGIDVDIYVVGNNYWNGSVSTDWFTGGNWCLGGAIPTNVTDVFIPNSATTNFDPNINNTGAVTRSINIESSGVLSISGNRNLDIWGDWNNSGTFNYNASTVTFKGTGNANLTGFTDPQEFNNLRVDKGTNATPLLDMGVNVTVYGALQPTNGLAKVSGGDLTLSTTATTIASTAAVEINGGNLVAGSNAFTNNGAFRVVTGNADIASLTNASGSTYNTTGGITTIGGNVANTGATVSATGGSITANGDWSNASSTTTTYNGSTIAVVGNYSSTGTSVVNANGATVSVGGNYTNTSSTLSLGGAIVVVGGNMVNTTGTVNQTGGAITFNTTGGSFNSNAVLHLDGGSNLNISTGTMYFERANGGTGNDLVILSGAGTKAITGGTFQFGNASTPASHVFKVNNSVVDFNNFTINNTNTPTVQLLANAATRSTGVLTVSGVLNLNEYTFTVKNSATSAITGNSYVLSEATSGNSKLAWNIGNNTGSYVFPFGNAAGTAIPFTFNVTTGGTQNGTGNVTVSTYPSSDDNTPWVSGVAHMNFVNGPEQWY
ncbi:MAG: hypothetical protein M0D57_06460 [Sphingobacteriales bacterium JAD_PAG50586_3]|nr:MAG: hypothetical protein M0D57_06460 [Sphingobacteriales bacterium JAD_PAG50586_3]